MRYAGPNAAVRDGSSGKKLSAYLRAREVSRGELSRRTGIATKTLSAICTGKRDGNMATWRAIARALGCTLDDITEV